MTPGRVDRLWAGAAGAVALAVYVRTLAPGLTADIDTAMFQFVGRVLGVPHNPGYPLYVLVTHAFSYLPIGSLAYRINLFSALCGAVTVSLAFGLARQLGCRRLVAAAGALGVAFGPVFWSQSLIAEVYTLDAAIVAGMWACLLGWARTRRDGWYFAAVGLFAAGLGNHTTIVGCAPGAVLYVLLVDRRFALRARTMAITAVLLAAGVLQYAFILVRSHQPGAYLESKAATVADLLGVMTGRQFADRLFAFGWHTVLFERIPWMVTDVFVPEVTLPGLLLAGAGGLWLLRRRLPDALLLSTGAAAVVGFGLNYAVVDTPVFLIPALLVLWLAAAVGLERLATLAERRRWALASVCAAAMLLPAWQLSRNFRAVDRSRDTRDATHLARLFEALPARAALVSEDFTVDRMLQFKLLGEGAARGRDISIVPRTASAVRDRLNGGARVFAFGKAADVLRRDALDVSFAPLTLVEGPLGAYLTRLEDGCMVAVAVPGRYASAFAAAAGVSLVAIGGPHKLGVMSPSSNVVVTGVRRGWDDARVTQAASDLHLALPLRAGPRSSAALAAPAEAWSSSADAAIRQGGRDLVRSSQGAVMATWRPDGRLADVFVLPSENGFQVPLPTDALSVYPVRGTLEGQALVPGWTDLAPLTRTGIVLVRLAGGAQVEMHVDGAGPLAPRVIDRSSATARVEIAPAIGQRTSDRTETASSKPAKTEPAHSTAAGGTGHNIVVTTSGARPVSVLLVLGGLPEHAEGRVMRGGGADAATVFRVDTVGLLRKPDRVSEVLLMGRDDQSALTGAGWSTVQSDRVTPYRWMTAASARVLLPVERARSVRMVRLQALRESHDAATALRLVVNGSDLSPQPLRMGWQSYQWAVPGGTLRDGTNEVELVIDRLFSPDAGVPARGIGVAELRLLLAAP